MDPRTEHLIAQESTTDGLPLAPSMAPGLEAAGVGAKRVSLNLRVVYISCIAIGIAGMAGVIAQGLTRFIGFFTNLAFYGRISTQMVSPANNSLGLWVILVPVVGGLIVGLIARFGSPGIRGHGIPEAMEHVLFKQSRIPASMTFLKPLSAAISIGTGGPFGAEGPIIATGGSLGSLVGQWIKTSSDERKTLLAAGAAAGMAATFGTPVSAVLLAIELLLFEYKPRSLIPVALAACVAAAIRIAFEGSAPVFGGIDFSSSTGFALALYILLGACVGATSAVVTRAVYWVEDQFEKIPIHWMWWPAIGAVAVGIIGYFAPRTLGVGYDNIHDILVGDMALKAMAILCGLKLLSWMISLGSGTSGGTLAPLLTVGGGAGALLGAGLAWLFPNAHIDPRIGALVGMAAMFAGASRALLTSVVFAFETTMQPLGLLPLLGGCSSGYLASSFLMKHSIMTEKIVRRGRPIVTEYATDVLSQILTKEVASYPAVTLEAEKTVAEARRWMSEQNSKQRHQAFPVLDSDLRLLGVVSARQILDSSVSDDEAVGRLVLRSPLVVFENTTLRQASDVMAINGVGRLPVVSEAHPTYVLGMLTRSDLLKALGLELKKNSR